MNNLKWRIFCKLMRFFIRDYKFTAVLAVFWSEFRAMYPEDNLPSALATINETLAECEKDK